MRQFFSEIEHTADVSYSSSASIIVARHDLPCVSELSLILDNL